MTGTKKILLVREQIDKFRAGKCDSLKCPYCDGESMEGSFCCTEMSQACAAVLHRAITEDLLATKAEIEERVSRN